MARFEALVRRYVGGPARRAARGGAPARSRRLGAAAPWQRARCRLLRSSVHEVARELIGCELLGRGRRRNDRRDRELRARRPGVPRLRRPDAPYRDPVRAARPRLRLPVVRHPQPSERGLRARGECRGGADPRAGADRGLEAMRRRRERDERASSARAPASSPRRWASGSTDNGKRLDRAPFELRARGGLARSVVTGPRIGITKATELPWRFCAAGSRFLSQPSAVAGRAAATNRR